MPSLSDTWLGILRVSGICAAGVAFAGLIISQPGVMMIGVIVAVLSVYLLVLQASLRQAALRRADAGTCRRCGYEHNLTMPAASSPQKCSECGAPLA